MLMKSDKALLFLCSGTKLGDKKLSHRIATHLQAMDIGEIGTLETLSAQHTSSADQRRKMIFINDCKSSCVKILTQGFHTDEYLYVDVTPYKDSPEFDIQLFVEREILPALLQPGEAEC